MEMFIYVNRKRRKKFAILEGKRFFKSGGGRGSYWQLLESGVKDV